MHDPTVPSPIDRDGSVKGAELARRIRGRLAGVRGVVELVRDRVEPRSWEYEMLRQALEALDRVDAEVGSLVEEPSGSGE